MYAHEYLFRKRISIFAQTSHSIAASQVEIKYRQSENSPSALEMQKVCSTRREPPRKINTNPFSAAFILWVDKITKEQPFCERERNKPTPRESNKTAFGAAY